MSALPPAAGLALAVRLLEARGFTVSGRNGRGDSLYLKPSDMPDCAFALRVSNHARTARQRRVHPEVLTSLVVARPRSPAQLRTQVEGALRDFYAAAERMTSVGDAEPD